MGNCRQNVSEQIQSNFPKNREILAKHWQVQSNFLKTREIRGKLSNILAKWLHYLLPFPNIRDFLINLLTFLWDFSDYSENSCQNTHINVLFFFFFFFFFFSLYQ